MEVCADEEAAAPEVTQNKGVFSRLIGLSGTERKASQRWKDLIQAVKKSKFMDSKNDSSTHFGSIRKNKSEGETSKNILLETNAIQISQQNEELKSLEIKSFQNNLQHLVTVNETLKLSQPGSSMTEERRVVPNNENTPDSFTEGISLLPQDLMKQSEEKYTLSKLNVKNDNEITIQTPLNIANVNIKSPKLEPHAGQNIDADNSLNILNAKTLSSSADNVMTSRRNLMGPDETACEQSTPELFDLNKNHEPLTVFNIPLGKYSNDQIDKEDGDANVAKPANHSQTPQGNISKADQTTKLQSSHILPQPTVFEREGWL